MQWRGPPRHRPRQKNRLPHPPLHPMLGDLNCSRSLQAAGLARPSWMLRSALKKGPRRLLDAAKAATNNRCHLGADLCSPQVDEHQGSGAATAPPPQQHGGSAKMERKPLAPPGFSRTFYKRQLPSPPAIEFTSARGEGAPLAASLPAAALPGLNAHMPCSMLCAGLSCMQASKCLARRWRTAPSTTSSSS